MGFEIKNLSAFSPLGFGASRPVCVPESTEELIALIATAETLPVLLGGMTNTCPVASSPAPIVFTRKCTKITLEDGVCIAEAGASLAAVCKTAKIAPALSTVPGSVGGAVRGNAGAFGEEIASFLTFADALDMTSGKVYRMTANELAFGYRKSLVKDDAALAVLRAGFSLSRADGANFDTARKCALKKRAETQPTSPSLGSVFCKYAGISAGKWIEDAGLKGASVGGAFVSEKHAGFITVRKNTAAEDYRSLVLLVRRRVFEHARVLLQPEIAFI